MTRTMILAATMLSVLAANAADLENLRPSAQWLKTERLRGTLFHQATIEPMKAKLVEPAGEGRRTGPPTPVTLRGWHHLVILVDDSGELGFSVKCVDPSEHFEDCIFAVFSPEGAELETGIAELGQSATVGLKGLAPGPYLVRLNSGPASSNAAEVTVRNRYWAIDGLPRRQYERSPLHYHFLRDLKLGGFNLAMVDCERLPQSFKTGEGLAAWTKMVKEWTDYAAKVKLRVMPAVNLGGSKYETEFWEDLPPGLFIEHKEGKPLGRCPLRREYWEALFLRRGREVAKLALDNPYIVGFALDPEMYQSWSYGHYMMSGTCFCDHCLGGFLEHKGLGKAILNEKTTGKERHDWLRSQKLLSEYQRWLADEMTEIAAWCREELHKIHPDLLLNMFVIEIANWFCEGIARGFGLPDLPVTDFCEHTYYSVGYDRAWLDKIHQRYKDWGANVLQGSALWDLHFPPTKPSFLAAHAYNLSINDEGWWYRPGDRLERDWGCTHAYLDQPAYFEDYWQACVWANRETDMTLAEPGRASPLAEAEVVPWKGKIRGSKVEAPEDLVRRQSEPSLPVCVAAPTTLWFVVPERAGEFRLIAQARGTENAATVTVRDPAGKEAGRVEGELDEPEELEVTVTEPGIWSIEVARHGEAPLKGLGLRFTDLPALLSPSAETCLAPITKKPGLIGYWSLDDGEGTRVADTSQRPAYDGRMSGAEWVEGKIGGALRFDGQSGQVIIGNTYSFNNLKSFSLSAWVRLDALPEKGKGATLVNKGPEAPVQHFWWWIAYPPAYGLTLELGSKDHRWGRAFGSGSLEWELGRWHHVATTFKSDGETSTAVFYRDGEKVGQQTIEEGFHAGSYDLKLGTYGGLHWLNGALDEVKLWDQALMADEVEAEYQRGP